MLSTAKKITLKGHLEGGVFMIVKKIYSYFIQDFLPKMLVS